jgi:serine/threonine protein kinase
MLKSGNPELAFAVDTWSLGCTIIEMFTGKPPWGDLQGVSSELDFTPLICLQPRFLKIRKIPMVTLLSVYLTFG